MSRHTHTIGWPTLPAAAAVLAICGGAEAQTAPTPTPSDAVSELVVTATRVQREGFVAPTPTTELSGADLQVGGHTNLQDVINDLPSATAAYNSTSTVASEIAGASIPELRDLGIQRTLVLIDGARPVTTEVIGGALGFDLNMVPLSIVKSVDVVTGGASASWGSDAVAGVINIRMDDAFTGVKASTQYGGSTEGLGGDDWLANFAAGANFAGGQGHIMGAFGYDDRQASYPRAATAPGQFAILPNPAFTATNGQPQELFVPNVNFTVMSAGGLIVSGPLKGTNFGPGGTIGQFQYGQYAGTTYMSGGDPSAFNLNDFAALSAPLKRENFYGRATYDVSPTTSFSADLLLGHSYTDINLFPDYGAGNIPIGINNAYLPAQIRAAMVADKITSFALGRENADFGEVSNTVEAYTEQLKLGAHGAFNSVWSWDGFASLGRTERSVSFANQEITANFANSVNAVISPTTGQPVCAVALTNPSTTCVPVDLLGTGTVSAAAKAYFLGTSTMKMDLNQTELAANVHGTPFSTWAGPVSVAAGLEYRDEGTSSHEDPITAAGGFALFNVGGLTAGSYRVGEAYAEAVAPLARDLPFMKSLDFDGGVRISDYSTSGSVPSWKVGLSDQVFDDLRLRGTVSRDIRAANLAELYLTRSTSISNVRDPSNNALDQATVYGGGNTDLSPEKADTATVGIIYQPHQVKGLSLSLDYYRIDVKDAISTLAAQTIVNQCFAGDTAVCGQITRVNGAITSVSTQYINIASEQASGFDFEADYATDLAAMSLPGSLGVRVLANYVDTLKQNTGATTVDLAGDITNGTPRVRASTTLTYTLDSVRLTARARYVEGGAYSKLLTVNVSVPDVAYFDLGAQWTLPWNKAYVVYADVDNVANNVGARDNNADYYDIVGRTYDVGLRVRF